MKKHVLVVSTSPRKGGNSDTLAEAFAEGAREAGHQVEKISLIGKDLRFCQGCLGCVHTGRCPIPDDAGAIIKKIHDADTVVFATPIYYYEMCGQMKTLLDRCNPLYGSDYAFRDVYLLSAAAEEAEGTDRRAVIGLEGWIACFEKARLAGTVFAGGVTAVGDIQGSPALGKAYKLGRNL